MTTTTNRSAGALMITLFGTLRRDRATMNRPASSVLTIAAFATVIMTTLLAERVHAQRGRYLAANFPQLVRFAGDSIPNDYLVSPLGYLMTVVYGDELRVM